jgi:ATP-dependent DNA helicase 2 subunit 1
MAMDELTKIKNVTNVQLQLKGFKPMKCLKDYHNLRSPTFIYPDEEAVQGSYAAFIALHRAMLQQNKFAVAFYGSRASSQLVALVPQVFLSHSCLVYIILTADSRQNVVTDLAYLTNN